MRESNFAFPAQNRACVCITSQLYDRRALDTTSSLPLFNSLTHLTYLTSTSPRIREIMTMDGGLERLVRILHDFCICPPPPDNPAILYGLSPPNARPPKLVPTLNPQSFDKHAAYRFSLAFQCVVNIGVRGSEPIRSRVVQAGTLDVVGCILEAWLANKGFAVGPSSSATGMPRETREQRQARRMAQAEHRQREEAAELAVALQREIQVDQIEQILRLERASTVDADGQDDEPMDISPRPGRSNPLVLTPVSLPGPSTSSSDTEVDTSTDTSTTTTPLGSNTPTGAVVIPSRDRSGTIIARPIWDQPTTNATATVTRHRSHRGREHRDRDRTRASPSPSTDTSRPDTETEDDGDVDMDRIDRTEIDASTSASPSPERHPLQHAHLSLGRRAVGIVSDAPPAGPNGTAIQVNMNTDAHIIINDAQGRVVGADGGVGVEDGIVSLEPNDDFAMGAPPGAPGAIDEGTTPRGLNMNMTRAEERRNGNGMAPDVTPRAGVVNLPMMPIPAPGRGGQALNQRAGGNQRGRTNATGDPNATAGTATGAATAANTVASLNIGGRTSTNSNSHHHRDSDSGPYRDEDVLLSLQLLAYLSKYPHVRQAFYKPRVTFHPASARLPGARYGVGAVGVGVTSREKNVVGASVPPAKENHGFFRAFASAAGRGKEKASSVLPPSAPSASSTTTAPSNTRQTNVFSLVERFTFRPSSTETDLPNPPPKLPPEIQYWAGVIMRNACRKDESRGGIRQCANMLCGRWESYPREFAKCRRCRKAKYCGKECQSTAWSEGHRFWCSAKDGDEEATGEQSSVMPPGAAPVEIGEGEVEVAGVDEGGTGPVIARVAVTAGGTITGRTERRERRERERTLANLTLANLAGLGGGGDAAAPRGAGFRTATATHNAQRGVNPSSINAIFGGPASTGNVRAEGSTTRERTMQAQLVPSQTRGRGVDPALLRVYGRMTNQNLGNVNATPNATVVRDASNYLRFDAYTGRLGINGQGQPQDQGGRRRAETVTGATASPTNTGGSTELSPHHHSHPRLQHIAERYFVQQVGVGGQSGNGGRTEAGPSRRRRGDTGFRSTVGDNDMVLG